MLIACFELADFVYAVMINALSQIPWNLHAFSNQKLFSHFVDFS
jgi:hypothetical protein